MTVAVFGATGYIGSRLVQELLNRGHSVRATYRTRSKLQKRAWCDQPNLEAVYCDIFKPKTIGPVLDGVESVYYLIHSMRTAEDNYPVLEKRAATNLVEAAITHGSPQIIYLGGLGNPDDNLSRHLRSRIEVGKLFVRSVVPATILRASIIIGSSSASFEILRHLVEKLPVMITPDWVRTRIQPISVRSVINYLIGVQGLQQAYDQVFDIGGPDVVTFHELIHTYAKVAGLRQRLLMPVPILSPTMSAHWVNFITPVDNFMATELVEGLRNETICLNHDILDLVPQPRVSMEDAISRALSERTKLVFSQSFDHSLVPVEWQQAGDQLIDFLKYDRRVIRVRGDLDKLWQTIVSIGGDNGWYHANFLWVLRGLIDELLGGPGIRRGRTHSMYLEQGDMLDCWRVKRIVEKKELILEAEMKLPGVASLKFGIIPQQNGSYILEQTALYVPKGLLGVLYWKLVKPLHMSVFDGMVTAIAQRSGMEIAEGPILIRRQREITSNFQRSAL